MQGTDLGKMGTYIDPRRPVAALKDQLGCIEVHHMKEGMMRPE